MYAHTLYIKQTGTSYQWKLVTLDRGLDSDTTSINLNLPGTVTSLGRMDQERAVAGNIACTCTCSTDMAIRKPEDDRVWERAPETSN